MTIYSLSVRIMISRILWQKIMSGKFRTFYTVPQYATISPKEIICGKTNLFANAQCGKV